MKAEDCLLPVVCKACRGKGVCFELTHDGEHFNLGQCTCVRCEGSGFIDVFGERVWESVRVTVPHQNYDMFVTDEELLAIFDATPKLKCDPPKASIGIFQRLGDGKLKTKATDPDWWLDLTPW